MIYEVFTTLLKYKPCRLMLLSMKRHIPNCFQWINMMKEWKQKDFVFQNNTLNLLGHGCLNNFYEVKEIFKFNKALVITDKVLMKIGVVDKVIAQLNKNKVKYQIYDGVVPNPTTNVIEEIVKMYAKNKCDALISVGGGSAHDSAKGACLVLTNNSRNIRHYQGLNVTKNVAKTPIIAINTTAGTGSGTTNVAVITDEENHFKMTLVDKNIQPHVLIDDSDLMMDLPPKPTSWVGVDTMVHAIEAYLSPIQNIIVQTYAKRAIKLVYEHLPIVYSQPQNQISREKLAYAEFMAGVAFNSASLGFIHSLSHAMSGVFNTPHGLANAIFLPYVLDYEIHNKIVVKRLCEISNFLGFDTPNQDNLIKAKECVRKIVHFLRKLNIPKKLTEVEPNISDNNLKQMAKKAMKDFCGISNPIQFSKNDVINIYKNAILGKFNNIDYEEIS